ncbi:glycosyltransferase [Granulicella sp. L60]|uniref:glycosyltransferase n=1 Tax=Granulicella sp. L60 TaxID=1641866 RepID=UPI0020B15358|nr:glycosyltransferase [Granulicella sp. L60]
MRFSVAMCTFNGQKHIGEQLESLSRQQLLPSELVLCDDGSTDNTLSIAEAFARQSPFPVKIVRNPDNLGHSRNFAKAINLCSDELIALSDQDDVWYPEKLARLAELFCSGGVSVAGVFSNGDLIDEASQPLAGDLWGSFVFDVTDQRRFRSGDAVDVLLRRNVVTGMTFAFRSSYREQLTSMPVSWNHDAWLALMLATRAQLIACPKHLVAYRLHGNQQIGVPITSKEKLRYIRNHGLAAYVQHSRDRNMKEYAGYAVQFDDLEAVLAKETISIDRELLCKVRAKAAHAHRGIENLSLSRIQRWPKILGDLEGYKQYSPTGRNAVLRDLLL